LILAVSALRADFEPQARRHNQTDSQRRSTKLFHRAILPHGI
jgi:hypothetical protein